MITSKNIKQKALALGFDACGIAKADFLSKDAAVLQQWLAQGCNGNMGYMANYLDKRTDPRTLFEGAQSIIVVLLNYYPKQLQDAQAPQVAKYAYGTDYHFVVKNKLRLLQEYIDSQTEQQCQICCDSAPVFERRWAERAGLGWIGKSGLLVNPKLGSYTLIGELITSLPLDYDTPIASHCGNCTQCLDACPTKAIKADKNIDARKCLSYLTIENREPLSDDECAWCNKQLFGCDKCLDACPWNRRAQANSCAELQPDPDFLTLDWEHLTSSQFKHLFKHSPLQRAGYKKISERLAQIFGTHERD